MTFPRSLSVRSSLSEHVDKGNVMYRQTQSRLNRLAVVGYDAVGTVVAVSTSEERLGLRIKEGQSNMDVSGIRSVSGATPARAVSPTSAQPAEVPTVSVPKDELEISSVGKMLDRLSETPEVRAERIAQIKEAIDNGAYDTDEKLEAALSKMFDSLGLDFDE